MGYLIRFSTLPDLLPCIKEAAHLANPRQRPGNRITGKKHKDGGEPCKKGDQPDDTHKAGSNQGTDHWQYGKAHAAGQARKYIHNAAGKVCNHQDINSDYTKPDYLRV